jgi:hypothetical protein
MMLFSPLSYHRLRATAHMVWASEGLLFKFARSTLLAGPVHQPAYVRIGVMFVVPGHFT